MADKSNIWLIKVLPKKLPAGKDKVSLSLSMSNKPVLVVIDAQKGFLDSSWGNSNNPQCESNIKTLLTMWRESDHPIVLVRHDSLSANSPLRAGQEGNEFQDGVGGKHDLLITKSVNSAFYGTPSLDNWLKENAYSELVICGITTNHCCETTARMAGNMGYQVKFVLDATRTFDFTDLKGNVVKAEDVYQMTATNLNGEFAEVVMTSDINLNEPN
ncbi:PncA Amidases related to nicotinamidase [actinobacterium SCGC AAA044-D11]